MEGFGILQIAGGRGKRGCFFLEAVLGYGVFECGPGGFYLSGEWRLRTRDLGMKKSRRVETCGFEWN
jgi:hypothetical protein